MSAVRLEHGDMREVLARLIAEGVTVDAVACDPPYHLHSIVKRFANSPRTESTMPKSGPHFRQSVGFMGQQWDGGDIAFRPETWRLVYDLLPPGGHLLAFSGTRTYHRMACAIEDAGFEIRDMVSWLYGSGFPKSHNVAKGIAKRRTEDLEPVRVICRALRAAMDARGIKSKDLAPHFGCDPRLVDHWAARDTDSQPSLPTMAQWLALKRLLDLGGELDAEVQRLNDRKGTHGERWAEAPVVGEATVDSPGFGEHRFTGDRTIRALDEEAAAWAGWGTALKPALEPICLARKPLDGTVAENVLKHGTGALNVDGCRVEAPDGVPLFSSRGEARSVALGDGLNGSNRTGSVGSGRWPANVVHDGSEEVVRAFPGEAGAFAPVRGGEPSELTNGILGKRDRVPGEFHADSGSAARFFYSAKADAGDRLGSKHPTVKPVDLMRWLVRLITPPGGTVLDPFAGSGTTGMACMAEGFDCILVEREATYVADIRRRIAHVKGEDTPLFRSASK